MLNLQCRNPIVCGVDRDVLNDIAASSKSAVQAGTSLAKLKMEGLNVGGGGPSLRHEVFENDRHYRISVEVPGVKAGAMRIELENHGRVLHMYGGRKAGRAPHDAAAAAAVAEEYKFDERFPLGKDVDSARLTAHLSDGVMVFTAPKADVKREVVVQQGEAPSLMDMDVDDDDGATDGEEESKDNGTGGGEGSSSDMELVKMHKKQPTLDELLSEYERSKKECERKNEPSNLDEIFSGYDFD